VLIDEVDLVLISRDRTPPHRAVLEGIEGQRGVTLRVHRVIGSRRPGDPNRWATIARARNAGKGLGTAPWVMFLDDDVVLGPGCVATLLDGLRARPGFAAMAADYLGEAAPTARDGVTPHVAMGATLFRRAVLAFIEFRWVPGRCECRCCCDDLRRAGFGIGYRPGASARHAPGLSSPRSHRGGIGEARPPDRPGRVLTVFNRRDVRKFRRQFVGTLRASGNSEQVTAVAYGLYPSERAMLASLPGVEVVEHPDGDVRPSIRRLKDFQGVLSGWPEDTPAAYWDAGDVRFQGRLASLWDEVRAHPDKLLVAREPVMASGPTLSMRTIRDPDVRRRAIGTLVGRPKFNGGFAAGTARALLRYLRAAHHLRHSSALLGTSGGDQIAMNLYCHSDPGRYHEVEPGWNYCLLERPLHDFSVRPDGTYASRDGSPVHVVHGNSRTLAHTDLSFLRL
jgi:hypothetical protein